MNEIQQIEAQDERDSVAGGMVVVCVALVIDFVLVVAGWALMH